MKIDGSVNWGVEDGFVVKGGGSIGWVVGKVVGTEIGRVVVGVSYIYVGDVFINGYGE